MTPGIRIGGALLALLAAGAASADPVETPVTIRVRAHDAKFIGSGVGGMNVVVENADTGALLASGALAGATGDTDRLMKRPAGRGAPLADSNTAAFVARLPLATPTRVRIRLAGPLQQPDAVQELTATTWVIPGRPIGGDGIVFNLPGLIVSPKPATVKENRLALAADVVLMCGCPITRDGLWDSDDYEVRASVARDGKAITEQPLAFSGEPNRFAGEVALPGAGRYAVTLWAHNARTGNSGVARLTVDAP